MPLVKGGRIVEDRYVRVLDDAPIPDGVPVIVPGKRFLADAAELVAARRAASACCGRTTAGSRSWSRGSIASRSSRWSFRNSATAAPTARRACCASATAFAVSCAPPATCCAISSSFSLRAGFDSFEVKKPADALVFAKAAARYSVFYQPSADGGAPALRRRLQPSNVPAVRPREAV